MARSGEHGNVWCKAARHLQGPERAPASACRDMQRHLQGPERAPASACRDICRGLRGPLRDIAQVRGHFVNLMHMSADFSVEFSVGFFRVKTGTTHVSARGGW